MSLNIPNIIHILGTGYAIEHFDEIGSTNTLALARAGEGAPEGTVISADFQTGGRGRHGTTWVAPPASSVLCSLILRPRAPLPVHHLAIMTGAGVAKGLSSLGITAKIKWPNDIMVEDHKVAGILVETTRGAVVVGIGVNCQVEETAFPTDARYRPGSLHTILGRAIRREEIFAAVVRGVMDAYVRVEEGGIIKVLYDWNTHNWFVRRKVRVSGPLGTVEGDALFLDGRRIVFHVFKNAGVVEMPLSSAVEAR